MNIYILKSHNGRKIGEAPLPDDDPQIALEEFEANLRAKLEKIIHDLTPEEQWLQLMGIDVSLERIMSGWQDDISDEIGRVEDK